MYRFLHFDALCVQTCGVVLVLVLVAVVVMAMGTPRRPVCARQALAFFSASVTTYSRQSMRTRTT